ncbi:non-ribosomal peptide synthetase [Bradyrhizobium sp. SZCCHNR3015]|uniref:non-ribosomal peptide synthetase n=1 Tax=Bradyrhizobium sp. SZCCHNR3015 TaxID=3057395 RepID=UPI0029165FC1|nr:non-ribosomal peptide synthetase [Bradyrhizobium sp. SZCCHNR3015]
MDKREELLELLLTDQAELDNFLKEEVTLSFAQERHWFLNQLSDGTDTSYNVPFALRLRGTLDIEAIGDALNAIVARHDVLRASFQVRDDKPVQIVPATASVDVAVLEPAAQDISSQIAAHARHVFDLSRGPLLKVTILRIGETDHILLLNFHHIVSDGWSIGLLVRELTEFYRCKVAGEPTSLPELVVQYADYAEWQRDAVCDGAMEAQLAYWLRQLDGAPKLLSLPLDRPRPERMTGRGAQARFVIPNDLRDSLIAFSAKEGVTLFMTSMAAFTVLLHRATGQNDILVGTPIAGRGRPEFENIIGCFVNTIVLRSKVNSQDTLADHLQRVKIAALDAYDNQDLPFEVLVEHLRPERDLSHTPVFQVMLALQNVPIGSFSLPGLTIQPIAQNLSTAKFDLNLSMSERDIGISAVLEYNCDVLDPPTIDKFVASFLTLLQDIANGPTSRRIADFDLRAIDEMFLSARTASNDLNENTSRVGPADRAGTDFWRKILDGELPAIEVPRDTPYRFLGVKGRRTQLRTALSLQALDRFRELAHRQNVGVQHCILAAFVVLQVRLTRQSDIVVGVRLEGEDTPTCEEAPIEPCRWSALRLHLASNLDFCECISRVCIAEEAAKEFALPIDQILARHIDASELRKAFLPVSFSFGCLRSGDELIEDISSFHLAVTPTEEGCEMVFHFSEAAHSPAEVERLFGVYEQLIGDLLGDPDRTISQARMLYEAERHRILHDLNPIWLETITESSLAQPFEECAQRMPNAIALIEGKRQLTYQDLDQASSRLAHRLLGIGLREGGRVAVMMPRGVHMVIGLYAVAKVGAAYVPIGPELPSARVSLMLKEASVGSVLVQSDCRSSVPEGGWHIVDVDGLESDLGTESDDRIFLRQPSSGIAYLMYTSGSTGTPKAVQFPINAAINSMRWLQRRYPVRIGDRHLFKTPFTFDVSIWEVFWPLYYGGTLVICEGQGHLDPKYLRQVIEDHRISLVNFVPSILQVFLRDLPEGRCSSLRWVFSGGEALTPVLRDLCYEKLPKATLLNLYGPTETHSVADTVVENDTQNRLVPLGRPSAAFRLYVLDEELEPMPIGVPGELYIGGDIGLAHGYCDQSGLTADRFRPDPFGSPGARMYRSGDICRYFSTGTLEYLGRVDRQVKIRGVRIELSEIEIALNSCEGVGESTTMVIGEGIDRHLVSFVVPLKEAALDVGVISLNIASALPRNMIPDPILSIPEIPKTPNGKTDITALAYILRKSECRSEAKDQIPVPQGRTEDRLKQIIEKLINRSEFDVTKSFFEIGGHSFLAFQLIAACRREFGVTLPMHLVYTTKVRELAAEIQTARNDQDLSLVPFGIRDGDNDTVIFLVHGASGTVAPFRHLAKHLERDFSVVGLQAPGLEGRGEIKRSVQAYAEFYIGLAQRVRRSRSIALVGWSFGGTIAAEMMRMWREAGVAVDATVLLDSFVLSPLQVGVSASDRLREADDALQAIDFLSSEISNANDGYLKELGDRLTGVLTSNLRSFTRFVPEQLHESIDLFRAVGGWPELRGPLVSDYTSEYRSWNHFVDKVVIHDIEGDHFNLLSERYSQSLATKIRDAVQTRQRL